MSYGTQKIPVVYESLESYKGRFVLIFVLFAFCPSGSSWTPRFSGFSGKKRNKILNKMEGHGQPKMVFPFVIGNESVPNIARKVFRFLDHKTLLKVRRVSTEWKHEVDQETSFWSDISPETYLKAVRHERMDIIQNMVDYAQDPNPANEAGDTPLHVAASRGKVDVCKLLLERVDDNNPRDNDGCTPLHWAAFHGRVEVCKLFLQNNADKNPRDNQGKTPLHVAAREGQAKVCKFLLENGADKNPQNNQGRTPLDFARIRGHQTVIALLSQ